jgi:hypothetical protein
MILQPRKSILARGSKLAPVNSGTSSFTFRAGEARSGETQARLEMAARPIRMEFVRAGHEWNRSMDRGARRVSSGHERAGEDPSQIVHPAVHRSWQDIRPAADRERADRKPVEQVGFRSAAGVRAVQEQLVASCDSYYQHGSNCFFVNYYYARLMQVKRSTVDLIVAAMPDRYAAMSQYEFFAELFAWYYDAQTSKRDKIPQAASVGCSPMLERSTCRRRSRRLAHHRRAAMVAVVRSEGSELPAAGARHGRRRSARSGGLPPATACESQGDGLAILAG